MGLEEISLEEVLSGKYSCLHKEYTKINDVEKFSPPEAKFYSKLELSYPGLSPSIYYVFKYWKNK